MNTGVIIDGRFIPLYNEEVESYLKEIVAKDENLSSLYNAFLANASAESLIIDFCVRMLGYAVIWNKCVYIPRGYTSEALDKLAYVKAGYKIETIFPKKYENGKFVDVVDPIARELELISFDHYISSENQLAFWYPKTKDLGFKTPQTVIVPFSEKELIAAQDGEFEVTEEELLARVTAASTGESFINEEMFVRLGMSSNKFNFETCHIKSLSELYPKLIQMLGDMYDKLEWSRQLDLVLRSFIRPSYQRPTIYHGMPLNTEFRVFYDFDTNELLGTFNYWDQNTMLDNLYYQLDRMVFAEASPEIERHFAELVPTLEDQVKANMSGCELKGKWSIDFLYDGENFVLIDMAHAECSYYYDQILRRQRANKTA